MVLIGWASHTHTQVQVHNAHTTYNNRYTPQTLRFRHHGTLRPRNKVCGNQYHQQRIHGQAGSHKHKHMYSLKHTQAGVQHKTHTGRCAT